MVFEGVRSVGPLLGDIAWPVTVGLALWWFRDQIKEKIAALHIWSGMGVNVTFRGGLTEVERLAHEVTQKGVNRSDPEQQPSTESDGRDEPYIGNSSVNPSPKTAAGSRIIDEDFRQLAAELRRKAGSFGYTRSGQKRYVGSMVQDLTEAGKMAPELGRMVLALRDLRNVAAASPFAISADDVIRYMRVAEEAKQGILTMPEPEAKGTQR